MSKRIPPAIAYTASVAFEKGLSIITIPLMALFLDPREYGRYDVAMSLVEFVGLALALGLPHTLIRFASTAESDEQEARCMAELLGTGLLLAALLGTLLQFATPSLMHWLQIKVELGPLRLLIASATVVAFIEMPLVWIRMKGQAHLFMYYTMSRAALQALTTWLVLFAGYGISGVMTGNSLILLSFAALLVLRQWRITGAAISLRSLRRIRDYGLPLVGASFAMFAIGNANRLFLPGYVSEAEIAHFGIASRLALAGALLYFPFQLWWEPQRIKVLFEKGGFERTVSVWKLGFSIILFSTLGVALFGPVFIAIALPDSYLAAAYLLPLMVLIMFIHLLVLLSEVGCYSKENSLIVLGIDVFAATLAVTGYLYLTPVYGLYGIIVSMIVAELVRLFLFIVLGWQQAPLRYPALIPLALLTLSAAFVYFAPAPSSLVARTGWGLICIGIVSLLLYKMNMIELPPHIQKQLRSVVRYVWN